MKNTLTSCLQRTIPSQDPYERPLHDNTLTAIEILDSIAIDGDSITENDTGDFYVDFCIVLKIMLINYIYSILRILSLVYYISFSIIYRC